MIFYEPEMLENIQRKHPVDFGMQINRTYAVPFINMYGSLGAYTDPAVGHAWHVTAVLYHNFGRDYVTLELTFHEFKGCKHESLTRVTVMCRGEYNHALREFVSSHITSALMAKVTTAILQANHDPELQYRNYGLSRLTSVIQKPVFDHLREYKGYEVSTLLRECKLVVTPLFSV